MSYAVLVSRFIDKEHLTETWKQGMFSTHTFDLLMELTNGTAEIV